MSRGDSEDRQRERDREYAEAWAKLSARERKQLAKAGITGPDLPVYHTGKHDQDTLLDRCGSPVVAAVDDDDVHRPETDFGMATVAWRIVGELLAQDNIRLTAECLAVVTGVAYGGNSMTDIARKYGVTRATVSKRCVAISDALGLPPSRAQRKLTARAVYERRARDCHHRDDH